MGFMDKIKGMFGGGATGKFVDKLVAAAEDEIVKRVIAEVKSKAEGEAKGKIKEIALQVMRPKLHEITSQDPTGLATRMGDQILEKAAEKVVDKVWDKVKDQIVQRAA